MKYCKQCECYLPEDYDLDICPVCLDDSDGLIPDCIRAFEEERNNRPLKKGTPCKSVVKR